MVIILPTITKISVFHKSTIPLSYTCTKKSSIFKPGGAVVAALVADKRLYSLPFGGPRGAVMKVI